MKAPKFFSVIWGLLAILNLALGDYVMVFVAGVPCVIAALVHLINLRDEQKERDPYDL